MPSGPTLRARQALGQSGVRCRTGSRTNLSDPEGDKASESTPDARRRHDYLTQNLAESDDSQGRRRCNARFMNVFADIVPNLSVRPFQNPSSLGEGSNNEYVDFAEDIHDLNSFASISQEMNQSSP